MLLRNTLLLLAVGLMFSGIPVHALRAQEKVKNKDGNDKTSIKVEKFKRMQASVLDGELARLKNQFDLNPTTIETIRQSLKPVLQQAAIRIEKLTDKSELVYLKRRLDSELQKAFWEVCPAHVPIEQREGVIQFFDEQQKLQQLRESNDRLAIQILLDGLLSFSREQKNAMEQLIEEKWSPHWCRSVDVLVTGSTDNLDSVFESIGMDRMKSILSDEQWYVLRSRGSLNLMQSIALKQKVDNDDALDVEFYQELAGRIMKLRIARIAERFEMDKKQRSYLAIAGKSTLAQLVDRWNQIATQAKIDPSDFNWYVGAMRLSGNSIPSFSYEQTLWEQAVAKALPAEQLKDYETQVQAEQNAKRRFLISHFVGTAIVNGTGVELSYNEFVELIALLDKKLEAKRFSVYWDAQVLIAQIDDATFKSVFDDDQWRKVEIALDRLRRTVEK